MPLHYAITGAGGYLGSRLRQYLTAAGCGVTGFTRRPAGTGSMAYDLASAPSPQALRGADVLVHCAYDFGPSAWRDIVRVNVEGSARLFAAARAAGVTRIVCISTLSAYEGCRSRYGRAKLLIEDEARKAGALIVRPGLVYGKDAGGMLGSLNRVLKSAPCLPLLGDGSWPLYLAHEADLCALIGALGEHGGGERPIAAAAPDSWRFRDVLSGIARTWGRDPLFIPVPWRAVWLGLSALESCGVRAGFRSDSVLGLVYPTPRPSFSELAESGIVFRKFDPELLR